MDRKIRPSGLTTFAILNFVFAGFIILGILINVGCMSCIQAADKTGQLQRSAEYTTALVIFSVLNVGLLGLLTVSGIGYLKLHRIAGRWCANVYALGQIAVTVAWLALGTVTKGEVTLFTVIEFVWPILTLFFINVVFRDVWKKRVNIIEAVKNGGQATGEGKGDGYRTPAPHIFLVMMQTIRQTLRGVQGILFIAITLIICFTIIGVFLWVFEQGIKQNEARQGLDAATAQIMLKEGIKQFTFQYFVWLLDEPKPDKAAGDADGPFARPDESRWAEYVSREKPALLSWFFAWLMALFPVFCSFLVFNQISDDARRKGFRYLLLRTSRVSIYFGKLLASIAIIVPIIIFSVAAISGYIHFKFGFYPVEDIIAYSLWGVVMLTLVSIPSIAFCLAVSGLINFGFGSLAASALTLGLFPIISRLLKDAAAPFAAAQFLLPLKTSYFLFHPEWWVTLLAAVGCLLYAAAFSAAGFIYFKRKSL